MALWERSAGKLCSVHSIEKLDSQEADLGEDLMVDGDIWMCKELLLSGRHS